MSGKPSRLKTLLRLTVAWSQKAISERISAKGDAGPTARPARDELCGPRLRGSLPRHAVRRKSLVQTAPARRRAGCCVSEKLPPSRRRGTGVHKKLRISGKTALALTALPILGVVLAELFC